MLSSIILIINHMAQNSKQPHIGFIDKYAIQYYAPCLQYLALSYIYKQTHEPAYLLAFMAILHYLGKFLPQDSYPVLNSKEHNRSIFQVFPLVAHSLLTWAAVVFVFTDYQVQNYSIQQTIGLIFALGFVLSASIDTAHQLIHRPQNIFRAIGFMNLAIFQFTVYPIQHLYLHHKQVGTDKDPITSPKNQNFYIYTIKAYFSAHKFVFNYSKLAFFVCMLTNWIYLLGLFYFAYRESYNVEVALAKVGFFILVGLVGFIFMEAIEYIQHYGLVYREDVDKKQINEISSWNSEENIIFNWLVFRFQRHSDHHMNAYKIFTTLELSEKMPRFPFSFIEGVYLAIIPPLWYYIMNPFVDEVLQKKSVSKEHKQLTKYIKEGIYLAVTIYYIYGGYAVYSK